MITLSLLLPLFAGCSGGGNARAQANDSISKVNAAIDEHNQLFGQARDYYSKAKDAIDSGDDPSGETGSITQARETMQEAQSKLQEAQQPLTDIQNSGAAPEIKEYAGLLSKAVDAQSTAEGQEVEYYQTLEGDPGLESDRQKALDTLAQASDGYKKAKDAYEQAQKLADSNPQLIKKS